MVKRRRNKGDCPHFAPDPGMQRLVRSMDAAFIGIAKAIEKEKFGDFDQAAAGSAHLRHRHKLLNHRAVGAMGALKTDPPLRWTSEELLDKALGAEDGKTREEAISALRKLGLKSWERYGAVIVG